MPSATSTSVWRPSLTGEAAAAIRRLRRGDGEPGVSAFGRGSSETVGRGPTAAPGGPILRGGDIRMAVRVGFSTGARRTSALRQAGQAARSRKG